MGRWIKDKLSDVKAVVKFIRQQKNYKVGEKIKVGFICQYIPAWNKLEPVYRIMEQDERFEPILICIPSDITQPIKENDTYEYYVKRGYPALNTCVGDGAWLDISNMGFDYVFYLRPYNSYMPDLYVSSAVANYAKICIVMYGMVMTKQVMKEIVGREFFRNVYYFFADSPSAEKHFARLFRIPYHMGLQTTKYYGMPVMTQIMHQKEEPGTEWQFSNNDYRIMWTPRWTTDLNLGGTNFFTYKDFMLTYAKEHQEIDFMFRPHPLMFDNFIRTGEMKEEEVVAFKTACANASNVQLDESKDYIASMWNSDVLVTDISGVVAEYFVMNKPLVYCASNMILTPEEHTRRILEGCYVVNNETELRACLTELQNGNDYLKEKRTKIIEELFGDNLYTSAELIVNALIRDAKKGDEIL